MKPKGIGNRSFPPAPRRAWMSFVALAALLALAAALGWREIFSPDIGTHLNSGRWIVENRTWPRLDPFVYTAADRPYMDLYWLYQVFLWLLFRVGGTAALVTAAIGLTFAAYGILLWRCRRSQGRISAWCPAALLLFALGNTWEIRPHIVSWILLGSLLLALEEYRRGRRKALWALPAVMLAWVNCHSMFVLGLGVMGICLSHAAWRQPGDRKMLALWGGLSLLACLINPYGVEGFLSPFREIALFRPSSVFMRDDTGIAELLSPFSLKAYTANRALVLFQPVLFMQVYALVSLVGLVANGRRVCIVDVLLSVAFFAVFAQSQKMFGYYVMVSLPLVVSGWERIGASLRRRAEGRFGPGPLAALRPAPIAAFVVVCAVLTAQVLSGYLYAQERVPHRFGHRFNDRILPVRACHFLSSRLPPGRILNSFGYGGYLGFATRSRVFMDGRTDIAGPSLYADYLRLFDPAQMPALLAKWQPDIALVSISSETPWLVHFLRDPGWRWVYTDEQDAVFVRRAFAPDVPVLPPPAAGKDYARFDEKDLDAILAAAIARRGPGFVRTLTPPHYNPLAELRWSGSYLVRGFPEAALSHGVEGLKKSTLPAPDLLNNVMQAFIALGDYRRAMRCFEALPSRFQDSELRRYLMQAQRETR